MSEHRMEGFQKRVQPGSAKPVGLAMVSMDPSGTAASCSCGGWVFRHRRLKVVEDAIDRHLQKRHQGRGIRL